MGKRNAELRGMSVECKPDAGLPKRGLRFKLVETIYQKAVCRIYDYRAFTFAGYPWRRRTDLPVLL